jgi:hypothetical protein
MAVEWLVKAEELSREIARAVVDWARLDYDDPAVCTKPLFQRNEQSFCFQRRLI